METVRSLSIAAPDPLNDQPYRFNEDLFEWAVRQNWLLLTPEDWELARKIWKEINDGLGNK